LDLLIILIVDENSALGSALALAASLGARLRSLDRLGLLASGNRGGGAIRVLGKAGSLLAAKFLQMLPINEELARLILVRN